MWKSLFCHLPVITNFSEVVSILSFYQPLINFAWFELYVNRIWFILLYTVNVRFICVVYRLCFFSLLCESTTIYPFYYWYLIGLSFVVITVVLREKYYYKLMLLGTFWNLSFSEYIYSFLLNTYLRSSTV